MRIRGFEGDGGDRHICATSCSLTSCYSLQICPPPILHRHASLDLFYISLSPITSLLTARLAALPLPLPSSPRLGRDRCLLPYHHRRGSISRIFRALSRNTLVWAEPRAIVARHARALSCAKRSLHSLACHLSSLRDTASIARYRHISPFAILLRRRGVR